jgi:hypothetical protein
MKLVAAFLLLLATQAQAAGVLEISSDAKLKQDSFGLVLEIKGAPAEKLFDAIPLEGNPGWEDVNHTSKSLAGLYCFNQAGGDTRYAECEISLDANLGVKNALRAQASDAAITLSLSGEVASAVYAALSVEARAQDAEGNTFAKVADGISAQEHRLTKSFDAVILVEPSLGVIR